MTRSREEIAREIDTGAKVVRLPSSQPPDSIVIRSDAELASMVIPPARFIVPGLIPIGLMLLSAPPKIGKTWLVLHLGAAVASGGLFCGVRRVNSGPVLMLDLEGSDRRAQERLRIVRGDAKPSPHLHIANDWPPMQSGGLERLEHAVKERGCTLVTIDVWVLFRSPRPRGADAYQHDYETAKQVHALAHKLGITIILVHHNRKAADPDWMNEVSGSAGIAAACDTIAVLKRDRGKADAVLHIAGRDIEEQELALKFEAGRWTLLGDAAEVRMHETRRKIFDCLDLAGQPLTPKQVADEVQAPYETVKQTLRRMFRDGTVLADSGKYRPARGTG